jgi:hypothetical protein
MLGGPPGNDDVAPGEVVFTASRIERGQDRNRRRRVVVRVQAVVRWATGMPDARSERILTVIVLVIAMVQIVVTRPRLRARRAAARLRGRSELRRSCARSSPRNRPVTRDAVIERSRVGSSSGVRSGVGPDAWQFRRA